MSVQASPRSSRIGLAIGLVIALGACSSINEVLGGDKVDYKSSAAKTTSGLEVPPDLTQLNRTSQYQTPGDTVSATSFRASASAVSRAGPSVPSVALQQAGTFRIERLGNDRWISTSLPPDQVFPQIIGFWKDSGFTLVAERAETGVVETDWSENRAKLPKDVVRSTIGKLFDGAYSTGELDKFRTRVERTSTGSDIYISHRGMIEVYTGQRSESTTWQPRPTDPQLEGEFLSRLMIRLGQKDDVAKTQVAASTTGTGPTRARLLSDQSTPTLQVDDGFDRAWRRVGLALDRSGFTVEDRDRAQGVYFVRYVDPTFSGKDEPGLLARWFSSDRKKLAENGLARYRIQLKTEGAKSSVAVLDSKGAPENSDNGRRIASLLLEDLK